jgi:oligopeptide/dipeptide ABC transporter ATP-binding protein
MSDPILEVKDVGKEFTTGGWVDDLIGARETVHAVQDVSLKLHAEETVALVGESGCGKSTIAKVIMGIHSPTRGGVFFQNKKLTSKQVSEKPIQMIFQDPGESLNPRRTVGANIATPLKHQGMSDIPSRIDTLLDQMGLDPAVKNRYPTSFSGGQKQRIAIARALATDPEVLIADEPVSGLDVSVQAKIINLLDDLQSNRDLSLLIISHNLGVVKTISDRIEIMYMGKIVERGKTDDVFSHPAHPYTRALLSAIHTPETGESTDRIILDGELPSPKNPPSGCPFHTRCQEYIGDVCESKEPDFIHESDNPNRQIIGSDHETRCHLYAEEQVKPRKF